MVITGKRPDGKPVEGTHIDGRPFSKGFEENVEFFRLDYPTRMRSIWAIWWPQRDSNPCLRSATRFLKYDI